MVAGFLYSLWGPLVLNLSNLLGKEQHHRATVTAIEKSWTRGATCRQNSSENAYRISVRWQDPPPGEGNYTVCLDDPHEGYQIGMELDVIADPWFGEVGKSVSPFWSWFTFGVLLLVALVLVPVGIIWYVGALRVAKDPDPRIIG